jgi:hypothetical protein
MKKVSEAYAKATAIFVELHKAHKISDAQLAAGSVFKASNDTANAYAAYCRINLKLAEATLTACGEEDEAASLEPNLSNLQLNKTKTLFNAKPNLSAVINYCANINQLLRLKIVAVDFCINLSISAYQTANCPPPPHRCC